MPTPGQVLADQLTTSRELTRWYLSKLKETDPFKQFEIEGKKLNNWYWIIAHLAWAEHFLIINGTGGEPLPEFEELQPFSMGNSFSQGNAKHDVKELLAIFKKVHEHCIARLQTITEEEMAQDNKLGFSFSSDMSKKALVMHCIRHEGTHTGNLAIMCKAFDLKTV
jgi:uncharacterized damage-inducible protein DinB